MKPSLRRLHAQLARLHVRLALAALVAVALLLDGAGVRPALPEGAVEPTAAAVWVQIAILVVSALISYALTPKPKAPEPQKVSIPVVEQGQKIRKVYGTVWIDDPMVLAFKPVGTVPIKSKGGK